MTRSDVSVVVVSNGRPTALARCLTGLSQLEYPSFEIVVCADRAGLAAVSRWSGQIKTVLFEEENISKARNAGIARAAGQIVAFIDDDAVPEPAWLCHLCGIFDTSAVAAGGFVIGRNGISLQWGGRIALDDGTSETLSLHGDAPELHRGRPGRGIKTEGTNMAFQRETLAQLGGFDPVFRFYLDETDLNLRLAAENALTAIVPRARVHHGFEASSRRRQDRVPRTLFEIGASLVAFLRRHSSGPNVKTHVLAERSRQRARLSAHLVAGRIEPGDVVGLLRSFDRGCAAGFDRAISRPAPIDEATDPFVPFKAATRGPERILSGWSWQKERLADRARALVAEGSRVRLIVFSLSARPHKIAFRPDGYWLQTGGLFGASDRSDPPVRFWRRSDRVDREVRRLAGIRDI